MQVEMVQAANALLIAPTVTAGAYTSGQCLGGLLAFAPASRSVASGGIVTQASAVFAGGIMPACDLVLFSSAPTSSTIVDRTTFVVATSDITKMEGVLHLTDTIGLGGPGMIQATIDMPYRVTTGKTLYGALVLRALATLTSASDLTVMLHVQLF